MYIYELKEWPHFSWNQKTVNSGLIQLRQQQGLLIGGMESIGFPARDETVLQTLTQEVVKSSEIEGEILDAMLVRSSVARHLEIEIGALNATDRRIDGVVEMVLDATQKFDTPLTQERLFYWHSSLFPNVRNRFSKINVGTWRSGPVDVISGQIGREVIHFEAPSSDRVPHEMEIFLQWLNTNDDIDLVLKSAIAHLWFVTIHPFEDGNGRIGRAIGDLLLARSEKSPRRFYSLSAQIQKERKAYYFFLEKTQKGGLDITAWIEWFFGCLDRAIANAMSTLEKVKHNVEYWKHLETIPLNERQRKIITRLLNHFEGKLTSSKWAKITGCSQDTAHRDILDLINKGILLKNAEGGRSTSYSLIKKF